MMWTTRPRSEFGRLAAIDVGQGPLVVLLHGVGLRAEAWNAQIDPLVAAGYRVVCPDMPGHGHTPNFETSALEDFCDPVAELLDQPAILIGHSMGALIATQIASGGRADVRGVIALNAVYRRDAAAQQAVEVRASVLSGSAANDPAVTLERWFGTATTPEREACAQWLKEVDPAGYKAAYTVFARNGGPKDSELAEVTCPALFMTGADEPNSTPRMSRDMARLTPRGQVRIIPDAAHMMPMTHADTMNPILLDFIQDCLS